MKRLITACLVISLSFLLLAGCDGNQHSVLLRLKFQPGAKYTYDQKGTRSVTVTEGDSVIQKGTATMSVTIVQTTRRVLEDSTAEVEEAATWEVIGPSKDDSAKVDTSESTRVMSLYLTPRGNVVDIEFTSVIDSTDAKYIRDYYKQGLYVFPEEPVRVGSIWTQTSAVKLPDTTAQASTTYTVKGFSKDSGHEVAIIDYEGNLVIPIEPSAKDSLQRSGVDRIHVIGSMHYGYDIGQLVAGTEKWVVNGDRQRLLKDGRPSHFKVAMIWDVSMKLVDAADAGS